MNLKSLIFKLATGLVLFSTQSVHALDFYAGADASYHQVSIAGEDFNPATLKVYGGAWLWRGIGAEINLSAGVADDSVNDFTLDMPTSASVYARFQSPPDTGLMAYFLLGYTSIELDGELDRNDFPGSERFAGGSTALGLMHQLPSFPGTSVKLEVGGHFVDSDIDILSLGLGLHHDF